MRRKDCNGWVGGGGGNGWTGGGVAAIITATVVAILSIMVSLWITIITSSSSSSSGGGRDDNNDDAMIILAKWSIAQWIPSSLFFLNSIALQWQEKSWEYWEKNHMAGGGGDGTITGSREGTDSSILDIPTINIQKYKNDMDGMLNYLKETYGTEWIKRPLLLQNLWSQEELLLFEEEEATTTTSINKRRKRRISRRGLLEENLTIPYFRDARVYGALSPNDKAPISAIMSNITKGKPHKIGTQFLVQTYPELIYEAAPHHIVTALFGNHFQPKHVEPISVFGIPLLPALTTVPLFVAATTTTTKTTTTTTTTLSESSSSTTKKSRNHNATTTSSSSEQQNNAFTALHCEPIGNVAVQLEGSKRWTLVSPQYSLRLKPSSSPDGRAFFVSHFKSDSQLKGIPRYYVTTNAGDALWVPTWTWHRVDYIVRDGDDHDPDHDELSKTSSGISSSSEEAKNNNNNDNNNHEIRIAIGASLFHLRPMDLIRNNPLFAFLVVPNLIKEALHINTQ